jgi:hypothetical protein
MPQRPFILFVMLTAAFLHAADKPAAELKFDDKGEPLPVSREESSRARDALVDAKSTLSKANSAISGLSNAAIDNMLWRNEEYRTAVFNLRRAQVEYDTVRRPIFDALRQESYYREMEQQTEDNQRVLKMLRLTGRGSFDYLFPQAMNALHLRARMTRAEIIAMAQAPEVEEARHRVLETAAHVRAIRQQETSAYSGQAQKAARAAVEAARKKVKDAQAEYAKALAQEAEYERQRQKWLADRLQNGDKGK